MFQAVTPDKSRENETIGNIDDMRVKPLSVGNLTIKHGKPAIIVSLTGEDDETLLNQASQLANNQHVQIAELRVDTHQNALDADQIAQLGLAVRDRLHGKPLLLTLRTSKEGGNCEVDDQAYLALYKRWLAVGFADLIDIEMRTGERITREIIDEAHRRDVAVILSFHDFKSTPPSPALLERLEWQDAQGADILKIAAMPHSSEDVIRLLEVTRQMREQSDKPLLTMSMGDLGKLSRAAGELFGSNLTFASQGAASAPGQLSVETLSDMLDALHLPEGRD